MTDFIKLNKNLGGVVITTEGTGADTKYYLQHGADTASKKSLSTEITLIGSWTIGAGKLTFTVDRADKGSLTADNFFPVLTSVRYRGTGSGTGTSLVSVTKEYDKESGTLTISKAGTTVANSGYAETAGDVYLIV